MKICCFTGPRLHKLNYKNGESDAACIRLKERINKEIEKLYLRGFRVFISGMAEGVDIFCAEAVLSLKEIYNDMILETVLPYNQTSRNADERYRRIIQAADSVIILQNQYSYDCFYNRNKYMVDKSDLLMAVYSQSGGTAYTIKYAAKCDKPIKILPQN